jgi:hypothetical protein
LAVAGVTESVLQFIGWEAGQAARRTVLVASRHLRNAGPVDDHHVVLALQAEASRVKLEAVGISSDAESVGQDVVADALEAGLEGGSVGDAVRGFADS